ncbi:type IV secretory system conjugative DNA transfer family protein [Streptomyces sp. NPDC057199]|uniref:type IV secretory system conjugative DNA transfer family protein n=1 Tax=Streptomyces sp. NPDC057199 TaxID=3346047 RepID=UPI00363867BE
MSSTNRKRGPGSDGSGYVLLVVCLLVLAAAAAAWTSAAAGASLAGKPSPPAPIALLFDLAKGAYVWPGTAATIVLAAELVVLALAAVLIGRRVVTVRRRRRPIDAAARHMGKGRQLDKLTRTGATATAARLGSADRIGVYLGRTVVGGRDMYGGLEDTHVDIWGPRTGKTTRKAIPALMDHGQAPALVTSNKRDIVDATRAPRAELGRVWVFDLQGLIGEESSWWWNPLSYVTDVATASRMAEHFASDSRGANARTDAFFEPAGQELLANLLLAAALGNQPITKVYTWLSNPRDETPEEILREAGPAHRMAADSVRGTLLSPEKQRGGVYGTARQMASCLRNPQVTQWVTPTDRLDKRPQFNPAEFVRGTDTLYLVSREGKDSAGALVTALTVAVCEAAEAAATRLPHGRLSAPLLAVLDEAANVCRWAELPNLYSHYGSRGILLITILQSWAQGVEVWGEHGMTKLWSSANVASYGGGVKDTNFLHTLSQLVGRFEALTRSHSYQPNRAGDGLLGSNRSTSISSREEEIVSVADLGALPPGRALILASGTPPTLIETVPWWERDFAPAVQASLAAHDPGGPAA